MSSPIPPTSTNGAPQPARIRPPQRGGVMRGYLSDIARRRLPIILYLVLIVAAGIDVAMFYQVLALVLRSVPDPVVWAGVAGFTAVALTLAHMLGMRMRAHRFRPMWTNLGAWVCFGSWLLIGTVAFIIRLLNSEASASTYQVNGQHAALESTDGISTTGALLPALLFLALYTGTGTIAAIAGSIAHQPEAQIYYRTVRDRSKAARASAHGEEILARVRETINLIDKQSTRVLADLERAEAECDALAERLRSRTRILLHARGAGPPWPRDRNQPDLDYLEDYR